ncbi:MAG: hypothetical protein QNJ16_19115 [Rhodobacter sp.]|nr:hypothetical protein [Rhodobacter sp.]
MAENGEGNNDGSGNGSGDNLAAVREAVDKETRALKEKNQELLNEIKSFKDKAKEFDGLDLDKLKNLQKHMDESEEAKLIADGKIDQVFDRRFARLNEDNATRYGALEEKYKKSEERGDKFERLYGKEKIRNRGIRAAEAAGVDPEAMEDVTDKILAKFSLGERGEMEARDEDGNLIMSKDGKTVLQPEEYISETLKKKHPYYWRTSQGGGLGGGRGGSGRESFNGADESAMVEAAKTKDMSEFRRLRNKRMSK